MLLWQDRAKENRNRAGGIGSFHNSMCCLIVGNTALLPKTQFGMLGRHTHTLTKKPNQSLSNGMYETCMSKKDDFWVTALDNSPAPCSITQEALMGNHLAEGSTSRPRTPLEHQIAEKSNSYCTCSARLEMKTTKFVTGSRWQGPKRQISFIVSFFFFLSFIFFLSVYT